MQIQLVEETDFKTNQKIEREHVQHSQKYANGYERQPLDEL